MQRRRLRERAPGRVGGVPGTGRFLYGFTLRQKLAMRARYTFQD
jgi:hypothetical protein